MKKLLCMLMFGMMFGQAEWTTRVYDINLNMYEGEFMNLDLLDITGVDISNALIDIVSVDDDILLGDMRALRYECLSVSYENVIHVNDNKIFLSNTMKYYSNNQCHLLSQNGHFFGDVKIAITAQFPPDTSGDEDGDGYDDVCYEAGEASVDTDYDGLVDEFPVINIIGNEVTVLTQTSESHYVDEGASCSDAQDGSISHWVEVSGDVVNLNMIGSYDINYNCSDSDGNQAVTKSRTVIVDQGVGDANGDGVMNVLDMVVFVEIIINDF